MGRQPCCDKVGLKKGPWTAEEDKKLINFILTNGQCCWRAVPKLAGLLRCGKSCRLRWTNYLRPDLKRGLLSEYEEKMVIDLHAQLGNRWSKIASHLPGRTDNEIKNHWNTHIKKRLRKMGIDPVTHQPLSASPTSTDQPKQKLPPLEDCGPSEKDRDTEDLVRAAVGIANDISIEPKSNSTASDVQAIAAGGGESLMMTSSSISDCTDGVAFVDPDKIFDPCSSSTSPSLSSSASTYSSRPRDNVFEDLQFPFLDWPCHYSDNVTADDALNLWDDGFCWDLLMNDGRDSTLTIDQLLNQCPTMAVDQTYGLY